VDKYIGDGLMAFFGDPVEHPDHALRAVRAAQDMVREAAALRSRWNVQGGLDLKIRIGINSGEAVVGNMGSERRVNYTAVGAHVNLAQRLEANARPGGILVSRAVYDRTEGRVAMKPAGTIRVKGFDAEVEVLEVEPGA
jgi:adenylate cyclase